MNKGIKHDSEKPRWDLLPMETLEEVVHVLTFGSKKYSENNWKSVRPKERYFAAAMRHLCSFQKGDYIDNETSCSHLSHAICSLIFLLYLTNEEKKEKDSNE